MRDTIAGTGLVAANVVGYVSDLNIGVVITGITAVGGAIYVAVIKIAEARAKSYEEIERAKIRVAEEWERVNAPSLKRQLEEMADDFHEANAENLKRINDANVKLHEARNEWQAERLRHTEERARLTEEIHRLTEELKAVRAQNQELLRRVGMLGRQVDSTAGKVQKIADQTGASHDEYPAPPDARIQEP